MNRQSRCISSNRDRFRFTAEKVWIKVIDVGHDILPASNINEEFYCGCEVVSKKVENIE